MANLTINLTKWYHFVLGVLPLLAALASGFMWLDVRYMHKEISDTRFIELNMKIVQAEVREFHKKEARGEILTPEERMIFDADKKQLDLLMSERNRLMGIGE